MLAGLAPDKIWECELWEYNASVRAYYERQKADVHNAIVTGYYAAYYINGGNKAKSPNKLIDELSKLGTKKQSFEDGLQDILLLQSMEKHTSIGYKPV